MSAPWAPLKHGDPPGRRTTGRSASRSRFSGRPMSSVVTPPSSTRRTAVPFVRGTRLRLPRHPSTPDPSDMAGVRSWVAEAPRPRAIDLFCGAGGLSLGLRDAGFSVLVGADVDAHAVETHTANVGGLGYVGDLADSASLLEHLDGWGIDEVELIAGGVPCQPFSRAGQAKMRELVRSGVRTRDDARAGLWRSFMTVVERFRPPAVLVENVPELPSWDDGSVLSALLEALAELGYAVDARIVDCFRHGVPQHRARLILVGLRDGGVLSWPEPDPGIVTLRDAIGDLPPVPGGQRAERLPYRPRAGAPLTPFQARMRRDLPAAERDVVCDHITKAVRADDHEAYTSLLPGQTYADIPVHLQRYRSDIFTDKYKRLSWDALSRTVTAHIAKDGYWYIHPEQHRTLSIREAARLQTFPDSFRFAGQPSHRLAQIGNAVPPFLGEVIGRALRRAVTERAAPRVATVGSARRRLLDWHAEIGSGHPWRHEGAEPWQVLVGELCLARSRPAEHATVLARVMRVAPHPSRLASLGADALPDLRAAGLSRTSAEALVAVAAALEELYAGEIPGEDLELRLLPGVGDGVAKAVLCFGFGRRAVPLDAVTARVAERVLGREERRRWQLRLDLHRLAGPAGPDAAFNGALLELGARICRSSRPRCEQCPLRADCATGLARRPEHRELSESLQEVAA